MKVRTTIEIDDELLARARRALGNPTTRATVEEALRRLADASDREEAARAARQIDYFQRLRTHGDLEVLSAEEMWS
ncbi:MAG TPA: type II toxin-antitoxin system VapB family antitoxin [Chloroflexota bacterium]|nr:type II toxin-antitoxin system VapB family antitoxin [Chloroflexota bacterium]